VRRQDRSGGSRRALYAAGLLGALLVAWFASGWAHVRARQRAVRDAPRLAAGARDIEVAPNPLAVTAAAVEAVAVARGFVARFVAVGAIAIVAAFVVVVRAGRGTGGRARGLGSRPG
jgi:hypothetical protein